MKTLKEINEILSNYNELIKIAKKTISVIEEIDRSQYNTCRYIETISFEDGFVYVTCNDTCRGCYDQHTFNFPLHFMTMTKDDLILTVESDKIKREEDKKKQDKEKALKETQDKEAKDLELYQKLKQKFGDT